MLAAVSALTAACSPSAPAARDSPAESPATFDLSSDLREISGLAMATPTSLFAHDDERAIVHEIELASGRTIRRVAIGDPAARGDFEGIAADRGQLYLITSGGLLYVASAEAGSHSAAFETHDTGAGATCEIEGLSLSPRADRLLILCKRPFRRSREARLVIFEWDTRSTVPVREPWRELALGAGRSRECGLGPSAIEWSRELRRIFVISARSHALCILDEDGRLLGAGRLFAGLHAQPEGLAVTPGGELAVADEAKGGRPPRLTLYPPSYLRQVLSRFEETPSAVSTSAKNRSR